ncbi:MAG: LysR substrate-binding domain-containing protein [Phycisphaerae bacterium]
MPPRVTAPHYKHNRLQQLRGFCQAAQTGSISRAAERLDLSQPSVSLQIQALEREFGVALFERRGPRIRLTEHGKLLYELSLHMVEDIDGLRETFAARRGVLAPGRLDIAAGESTILYILPRFVRRFADKYPQIELSLVNVTGHDGLALLRKGEVDLACGSMIDTPRDVVYRPLFAFQPTLVVPPGHGLARRGRVTLEQIASHPFILPPRHLTTWSIVTMAFEQRGLKLNVRLQAGGWEVIKKYVELGLGVSIVTNICLTPRDRLVRVPVDDYFAPRTYGVVLRRNGQPSPQAERFLEMIDPDYRAGRAPTIRALRPTRGG